MARMEDWQREAREIKLREMWSLRGPNQVVKVKEFAAPVAAALDGYITLGKFLLNKTPAQIEAALGLKKGSMKDGARVYRFTRLPQVSEYEYELTADFPDGLAYHPAYGDPRFLPGSRMIPQWKIRRGVQIPVDSAGALELKPGQIFPYSWLA